MTQDHAHGPVGRGAGVPGSSRASRVLWITLGVNAALLAAEVVGGLVFGSLALLADAAHQASDVAALGIAIVAQALVTRPGSARHTYGLRRAEALGAQVNAVLLLGVAVWVVVEAVQRLGAGEDIDGAGVILLATIALTVNVVSALVLARLRGHDLNLRGAYLHMVADAAGSAGAVGAGVAVVAFDAVSVDAVASILIALLVVWSGWRLLRDTTNVLLEGAPRRIDVAALEAALLSVPQVEAVHHLHVWEVGSDMAALSVHVVLDGEPSLHDAQTRGESLKAMLAERFGIEHATLELECHDCGARHDVAAGQSASAVEPGGR